LHLNFGRHLTPVFVFAMIVSCAVAGCGYRVAGRVRSLPKKNDTIAVPVFANNTASYRIEQKVTDAVVRELLARTQYHVISSPESSGAILRGTVNSVSGNPIIFDTATGRATAVLITVGIGVTLQDSATSNVLYRNDNMVLRETYEISTDVESFFQEEGPALDRLARDLAATVVAAVLENY
jgi:hypothetical protein